MKLTGSAVLALVGVAAAAALGYWLYTRGGAFVKKTVSTSLNPASPANLAYQGTTSIVKAATGDANQTPGGLAFDKLNPRAGLAPNETLVAPGIIRVNLPTPQEVKPTITPADTTPGDVNQLMLGAGA